MIYLHHHHHHYYSLSTLPIDTFLTTTITIASQPASQPARARHHRSQLHPAYFKAAGYKLVE
ncbi:hypothetical protein E2C01_088835 [Portunus trituberculatus]|uniref:Uncharacterized protein n=1 Tax=Portunus trituberculatus TaxID=210409 RepID=A0A5B7JGI8_PORTR|nr:hypothetical protein [Portunus trituberculatus]